MDRFPDYEKVEYHLVYSELIHAARKRGTVTYQELAHVVGLPLQGSYMGKRIGEILGAVSQNEVALGRPMLSAVAVNVNGVAGPGFYGLAREWGMLQSEDATEEKAFWQAQKAECYRVWQQQFPKQEKS